MCVRWLRLEVLHSKSYYLETDTAIKCRKSSCLQADTFQKTHSLSFSVNRLILTRMYTDKALLNIHAHTHTQTHVDTHGRALSDGHWPRAVVMLCDFSFLLHCELSFPSFPPQFLSLFLSLLPCCSEHWQDSHLNVFI